ncbi:hypothetical protein T08_1502 [Trichinella sp. T8]|nr:hypothetical protein T08_1502 [Trichinella sp. T8]
MPNFQVHDGQNGKWTDTPLFDRLLSDHSGRQYQLHGKVAFHCTSNVTFVAAHFGCDWQLFSIGCGAHNQLYCTYNGTVMSSFVHRLLSLPGSVELLCTTGLLLAKQAVTSCVLRLHQLQSTSFDQSMPKYAKILSLNANFSSTEMGKTKLYRHIFAPLLTTNESDTFSSRAGGSSCQSATSLPISEYLCTQYFIKASNFQSVSECEWYVFFLSLTIRVEED